jgi:hypothetical protein
MRISHKQHYKIWTEWYISDTLLTFSEFLRDEHNIIDIQYKSDTGCIVSFLEEEYETIFLLKTL